MRTLKANYYDDRTEFMELINDIWVIITHDSFKTLILNNDYLIIEIEHLDDKTGYLIKLEDNKYEVD